MSRIRTVALTGLVLVGALAFAACGGGDDKDKDDGGKTPSATSSSGDGKTVEAEPTKENGDGGTSSDDVEELKKVAEKFKNAKFQAVYEVSGGAADSPFGAGGEITITKDGADKLRFDIKTEQDGEPFEGSFIQNGADSYICFSGAQATALLGDGGGEGACLKSSADDPTNPIGDISDTFGDLDVGNVEIQDKSEKKIAGEDATCYEVLDKDTDEVSTACFSDDGVLLSIESTDTTFVAKSVEGDVSGGDFEPPYEIVEVPGLGQ